MLKAALSLLVSVTGFVKLVLPTARLPNARLVGERVIDPIPAPDKANRCGDPSPGKTKVTSPLTPPTTEGLNCTANVQLAPAASEAPQVLLGMLKSPLGVIEVNGTATALMFFSVTVFDALDVAIGWFPKARLAGDIARTELIVNDTDFVLSTLPATSVLWNVTV